MEWQPIETAPSEGPFLVWDRDGYVDIAERTAVGGGFIKWDDPAPHRLYPTHWMPLPGSPTTKR